MSKGNVLIIEDDHVSGTMLLKTLERLGYTVGAWQKDGNSALKAVQEQDFDLILTDYYLPDDFNGVELNEKIQAIKPIPAIFITSSQEVDVIDDIVMNGPYGYIHKPIWPHELRAVIDLTLIKAGQDKELKGINIDLDKKVKERTQELDQAVKQLITEMSEKEKIYRKLQDALKSEKEFGELKSKIISNLSHEFKTPLSSIRSSAQLIKAIVEKTQGDERSVKHANKIEKAVGMLTDILMRILSVEKDDNRFYDPQAIKFDLDVFFQGLTQEFELDAGEQIEIEYQIEKNLGLVYSDPNLLRLIYTNLVSNACKYSPFGGKVRIDFKLEKDKNILVFKVQDHGIGMTPEDVNQVFFRFYRGQNVGSIEGTGIGLSIVNRAINSMGGDIKIESEVNRGTTIVVTVPFPQL